MKESHRKRVASHPDPESCVGSRKAADEALTGAHAGWVLSCEIIATGVRTSFRMAEGNTVHRNGVAPQFRDHVITRSPARRDRTYTLQSSA
jgi:hypothetical protein